MARHQLRGGGPRRPALWRPRHVLPNHRPPTIDPVDFARALGITADTGAGYQFTDAYGVTYTGSPAPLTVSALARRDLAADMFHDGVGPASLRYYTDHLLHDSVPNPDHALPRLFDNVHRSLRDVQSDQQHPLQVIATAPDGDDEIQIGLDVEAVEVLSWNFTAPIPYRVDQLNTMLMRSDFD